MIPAPEWDKVKKELRQIKLTSSLPGSLATLIVGATASVLMGWFLEDQLYAKLEQRWPFVLVAIVITTALGYAAKTRNDQVAKRLADLRDHMDHVESTYGSRPDHSETAAGGQGLAQNVDDSST